MKRIGDLGLAIFSAVTTAAMALAATAAMTSPAFASDGAGLTALEAKWIDAADPVLNFAVAQGLPIDVVVRPISEVGDVPFSVGVKDRRCKLILSMRDKADAEATLSGVSEPQHPVMIEAMTAHEMAHCWRYAHGVWNTVPAGFVEASTAGDNAVMDNAQLAIRKAEMRASQREEAFADLVALAWTKQHHPEQYAAVYAWLSGVRHDQPMIGSYHDTRIWLALAQDASVFPAVGSPFEQVQELWVKGLLTIDP